METNDLFYYRLLVYFKICSWLHLNVKIVVLLKINYKNYINQLKQLWRPEPLKSRSPEPFGSAVAKRKNNPPRGSSRFLPVMSSRGGHACGGASGRGAAVAGTNGEAAEAGACAEARRHERRARAEAGTCRGKRVP